MAIELSRLPGLADNSWGYNGLPCIQDNVVTVADTQYAVWWDSARHPLVGKRNYPGGAWATFDLSTLSGNPLASPVAPNGHNCIVMAIDATGLVHIAGNHHNDSMRYIRSTNAGDITSWTAASPPGQGFTSITYPQFVKLSTGELFISYRSGVSGHGDNWLEKWDEASGTWASERNHAVKVFDGVASGENPYLHHIAVGPDDSIHQAVVWRVTGNAMTNNDLCHIVSRDKGQTWQAQDGTPLAVALTHTSTPLVLDTAVRGSGILNTCGLDVDVFGNPHIATHIWSPDHSESRVLYSRWNGAGWTNEYLFGNWTYKMPLDVSSVDAQIARPSVFATTGGRVFVIYRNNVDSARVLRVREVTAGGAAGDAAILNVDLYSYEPTFDSRAVRDRGELHMLVTPMRSPDTSLPESNDQDWTRQPIGILTVDLSQIDAILAGTAAVPSAIEDDGKRCQHR